jgi:hypothetical protein
MIQALIKGIPSSDSLTYASEKELRIQSSNDLSAISLLGITSPHSIPFLGKAFRNSQESIADSVGEADVTNKNIHLVRATPTGEIVDTTLNTLKIASIKVGTNQPYQPGLFSNGTLRCIVDQRPVFLKNSAIIHPDVSKAAWFFNKKTAYSLPLKKLGMGSVSSDDDMVRRCEDITKANILAVDPNGITQRINININPDKVFLPDAFEKSYSLCPEKGTVFTLSRFDQSGNQVYIHRRFDLNTSLECGPSFTNTSAHAGAGYCEDGSAQDGWHVMILISGYNTASFGYSIVAQSDDGKKRLLIADDLPEIPKPLELRLNNSGNLQVVYSFSGTTRFAEYNREGMEMNHIEWKSSPMDGQTLLLSERNLLFIPKAGGYDAYRIFGEGKPEKAFEIYFRGSSDYVILLPNGFYAGSPGCERLITLQAGDGKVDASALAPWRNRPSEVIKALGGDPKTAEVLAKVTDRWLKRTKFDATQPEPKASEIPKVEVNQMPPLWAQGAGVSFPIEVMVGAAPLKEVTVRVNGIPQQTVSGADLNIPSGGKGTVQGSVTLAQYQNWIEVSATDEKGRVSNQAHFRSILPEAPEKPKRYIVAMGCSEYDRPELNLQYAAKDAGDVLKTFQEAGGRDCKTLLLTNKEVGPEALEKIKAFVGESKESDEVILFCAGHGLLDEHLDYVYAGHQIDPEHPGDTGIHLDALLDAIKAGKSLKRLVLMDTCQSGTVGEKEEIKLASASTELPHGVRAVKSRALKVVGVSPLTGDDQQRFIEEMFLLPGQHRGINIIGASGGAEYAMESDKWNNGVFTSALIEALHDKKADMDHRGRISVSDLKTYLGQRVPELTGGAQKPSVVAFEQDQDFDLVGNMPPVPDSVRNQGSQSSVATSSSPTESSIPTKSGADSGAIPWIDAVAVQSFEGSTPESVAREYVRGIESQEESVVSGCLADRVDYYSMGLVVKSKAISDIRGDWKHFRDYRAQISNFQMNGPSSCQFVYEYSTMQGTRPRNGKLLMNMSFTADQPPKICSIKAKILGAK